MLIYLADYLAQFEPGFDVFRYLTMRMILAILTAMLISFLIGPAVIRKLATYKGQPVRDDGPESHFSKAGTPTMGGVLILIAIAISTLLWADLSNGYVWVVLIVTLGFGGIGFADDLMKLTQRSSSGLSGRYKLLLQGIISLAAALARCGAQDAGRVPAVVVVSPDSNTEDVRNTLVVSSGEVSEPVAVRYAYTMRPVGVKLYNREGLPASPFRTDRW